jgi:hypothetical protein
LAVECAHLPRSVRRCPSRRFAQAIVQGEPAMCHVSAADGYEPPDNDFFSR